MTTCRAWKRREGWWRGRREAGRGEKMAPKRRMLNVWQHYCPNQSVSTTQSTEATRIWMLGKSNINTTVPFNWHTRHRFLIDLQQVDVRKVIKLCLPSWAQYAQSAQVQVTHGPQLIFHDIISVPPLVTVSERQSEVHRPRTQAVQGRRFHLKWFNCSWSLDDLMNNNCYYGLA